MFTDNFNLLVQTIQQKLSDFEKGTKQVRSDKDASFCMIPYKLGWVGKNGRPNLHTQGVTRLTGDAINAFRKKIGWENFDWSLYF